MKKLLFLVCVALLLVSCGGDDNKNNDNKNKEKTSNTPKMTDNNKPQKMTDDNKPPQITDDNKPPKNTDDNEPQKGDKGKQPYDKNAGIVAVKSAEAFETKFVGKLMTMEGGNTTIKLLIAPNKKLSIDNATAIPYIYTYSTYNTAKINTPSDKCVYILYFKYELEGSVSVKCGEEKKEKYTFKFNSSN